MKFSSVPPPVLHPSHHPKSHVSRCLCFTQLYISLFHLWSYNSEPLRWLLARQECKLESHQENFFFWRTSGSKKKSSKSFCWTVVGCCTTVGRSTSTTQHVRTFLPIDGRRWKSFQDSKLVRAQSYVTSSKRALPQETLQLCFRAVIATRSGTISSSRPASVVRERNRGGRIASIWAVCSQVWSVEW